MFKYDCKGKKGFALRQMVWKSYLKIHTLALGLNTTIVTDKKGSFKKSFPTYILLPLMNQ